MEPERTKEMRNKKLFDLILTAILGAIIVLMTFIPQIGYITVMPGVSITLVHIPVIIGVTILGLKESIALGAFFGISSMIVALTRATNPFDLAFKLPWISVLPRILFAIGAHFIVKGFKKLGEYKNGKFILFSIVSLVTIAALFFGLKEFLNEKVSSNIFYLIFISSSLLILMFYLFYIIIKNKNGGIPAAFLLSSLLHTILVLSTVAIFKPNEFYQALGGTNNMNAIKIIYSIAVANGMIEAIIASIIGTPVVMALLMRFKEDE